FPQLLLWISLSTDRLFGRITYTRRFAEPLLIELGNPFLPGWPELFGRSKFPATVITHHSRLVIRLRRHKLLGLKSGDIIQFNLHQAVFAVFWRGRACFVGIRAYRLRSANRFIPFRGYVDIAHKRPETKVLFYRKKFTFQLPLRNRRHSMPEPRFDI